MRFQGNFSLSHPDMRIYRYEIPGYGDKPNKYITRSTCQCFDCVNLRREQAGLPHLIPGPTQGTAGPNKIGGYEE